MNCRLQDSNGWCTGPYEGFGCIKDKCYVFRETKRKLSECPDLIEEGLYCAKYESPLCTFGAPCDTLEEYMASREKMSDEMRTATKLHKVHG